MRDDKMIDEAEALLATLAPVECPVKHRFIPGLYIREIFMPAGTMITSKIHKTEHPFIISKGKVTILIDGRVETLEAPHCGITKPGTRRILLILEDCVWTTIHPTNKTTPEEVEADIIELHDNPLLSEEIKLKNHLNVSPCHLLESQPGSGL